MNKTVDKTMKKVGLVGWRGMVGSVLLERMEKQNDFANIGVELKTIPIDASGNPLETTYVCYDFLDETTKSAKLK